MVNSATLIIPIEIARKYGIDKPANVIVEEQSDGILIRKLNFKKMNKMITLFEHFEIKDVYSCGYEKPFHINKDSC
jgi:bifunctional DNA-binding transcriptional regulator/antitoxin component of YhaV-PrlF toxin-antitoxin module